MEYIPNKLQTFYISDAYMGFVSHDLIKNTTVFSLQTSLIQRGPIQDFGKGGEEILNGMHLRATFFPLFIQFEKMPLLTVEIVGKNRKVFCYFK